MNIHEFKPSSSRITKNERVFLLQYDSKWCSRCCSVKKLSEFRIKKRNGLYESFCNDCLKEISETYRKLKSVSITDLQNFRPQNPKRVSITENKALKELGYKWCNKCKKIITIEDFGNYAYCKECTKKYIKRYKDLDFPSDNKRSFYARKYHQSEKGKLTTKQYRKFKMENPAFKLRLNLSNMIVRVLKNNKTKTYLDYLGVDSCEDFISLMSAKTSNKNWLTENYHIDHIWQCHWFSEKILDNAEFISRLINNHKNLRPLPAKENFSRDRFDFIPLKKEDFPLYKDYLNPDIKEKIEIYFSKF
jgi:hypothetical protein